MGSLFDGIGGFPLAAIHNGVIPLWVSEIEPFPIRVTQQRLPGMLHYGDITKLDGAMLPPVDIICGGSPCQDLSVAGARAGLAGERSGLIMEQIHIVKEMRDADRSRGRAGIHIRPRFMVWENVPGAFSSGERKGEDFRIVLEEIVRIKCGTVHVPGPYPWAWQPAGRILLGTDFSLCWRCLDAQYWGVPQRRKRIFLIADFAGRTADKVLFDAEGLGILRRAFERGKALPKKLERALKIQAGLALPDGQITDIDAYHINQRDEGFDGYNGDLTGDVAATLGVNCGMSTGRNGIVTAAFSAGAGASAGSIGYHESVAPTLKAGASGNCMPSVLCINDQGGQVMEISENMTGTLRAQEHGHQPLVYENHGIDSRYRQMEEVAPTMSARYGTGGNNVPLVEQEPVICITGNAIDRQPQNGGNGIGYQQDIAYTLTATDHHAVYSRQRVDDFRENAVVSTQSARQCKDAVDLVCQKADVHAHLIRRLTPLECERLQGFPDGWTDIPGASDSARYKALGNSVAIPCVDFVMHCLVQAVQMSENIR